MKTAAFALVFVAGSVAAQAATHDSFRRVDPQNLVLIDTKYGEVAVELAPDFAPNHVTRLRALIHAHFYDGRSFYRVIDRFVAQGGASEGTASTGGAANDPLARQWPPLKAEFDAPRGGRFTPLGSPDLYAPEVGHLDGFPVAREPKAGRMWLVQCPGTFAFARDNGPDTATTEFYIVVGEAPRRLDRDLTAFGRVIDGMQCLQKLQRGDPEVDNGVIKDRAKQDRIVRVRLAADLPAKDRPSYVVERTDTEAFEKIKEERRHPSSSFYFRKPPPILDVCLVPVKVKRI